MSTVTLKIANTDHRWPVGTSVGIYKASGRPDRSGQAPTGVAVASATVASDGSLSFASIDDRSEGLRGYIMWAASLPNVLVQTSGDQTVSWAARH